LPLTSAIGLGAVGAWRAYFELAQYDEACRYIERARQVSRTPLGMAILPHGLVALAARSKLLNAWPKNLWIRQNRATGLVLAGN